MNFFRQWEFLPQKPLAHNFLCFIVIALVKLDPAFPGRVAPRFTLFPKLGKNTLITHADSKGHLRRPFAEAVIFMGQFIIFPKLLQIHVIHVFHSRCLRYEQTLVYITA